MHFAYRLSNLSAVESKRGWDQVNLWDINANWVFVWTWCSLWREKCADILLKSRWAAESHCSAIVRRRRSGSAVLTPCDITTTASVFSWHFTVYSLISRPCDAVFHRVEFPLFNLQRERQSDWRRIEFLTWNPSVTMMMIHHAAWGRGDVDDIIIIIIIITSYVEHLLELFCFLESLSTLIS